MTFFFDPVYKDSVWIKLHFFLLIIVLINNIQIVMGKTKEWALKIPFEISEYNSH